jgi:hypothetical protein
LNFCGVRLADGYLFRRAHDLNVRQLGIGDDVVVDLALRDEELFRLFGRWWHVNDVALFPQRHNIERGLVLRRVFLRVRGERSLLPRPLYASARPSLPSPERPFPVA